MKLSRRGLALIEQFEQLRLHLYNDDAGHCTVGYGHLVHPGPCDGRASEAPFRQGISRAEADRLLRADVARFEEAINHLITVVLSQTQFDALVSWAFNVGTGAVETSDLRRRLNKGEYGAVPEELARWIRSSGKVWPGLVSRRHKEAMLFAFGDYGEETGMTIQLRWPTEYNKITQFFGDRPAAYSQFGLPGHDGLDFRAYQGSKIFACAAGIVKAVYTDVSHAYGINVRLSHPGGWETIYAHLQQAVVKVGQEVKAGQVIAFSDNTGNSQAAHLHLTLKKAGATARGETPFPNDIVDPRPYLLPFGATVGAPAVPVPARFLPDHPLRGLHDGVNWMFANGVRGWTTEVVYAGANYENNLGLDYEAAAAAGIRVIVRLNYGYAKADGGLGTYPEREDYDRFVQWCLEFMRKSKGIWGWVIGNEPNRAAERANPEVPITPDDVTYLVNQVWYYARKEDRISPPALDPTNIETGDPREYFRRVVTDLQGAEFFALHGYGYGRHQLIGATERFRDHPMTWQYHSFKMWETFAEVLYTHQQNGVHRFRSAPLVLTEANHLYLDDLQTTGWEDDGAWVRNATDYVQRWNSGPGEQFVQGICFYRFEGDSWALKDKAQVLRAIRESGEVAVMAAQRAA